VIGDVFERWAVRTHAPGLAWGLVRSGVLVEAGGVGTPRAGEDVPVDVDSVFRIASMTKSFTGAALMTLVVEGRVRLDEPVATYVPELAPWRGPTADGPPITVRHLVSMESGLPNDDAWADRHNDMTAEQMDALIAAGATFAWTPGTRFEYANLGWGLVGRVIERASGVTTQELVRTRLLEPLGMASTTWTRPDGRHVAEPYRWAGDGWRHDGEPVGDGAIAPMGGLWSTVRDLATWIGFFQDAWPPRDDPDDGPLPRWARREMQQMRRVDGVRSGRPRPDGPSRTIADGYGVGLAIRHDPRLGHVVGHSGGLPGYGSHMRWVPEHGVGVVALSNVTYGAMTAACDEAIDVLADLGELGPARPPDAPALRQAADRAAALLTSWSDTAADALFTDNVALDEPYQRRAHEAAALVTRHGPLTVGSVEAETPMRGTFETAEGLVRAELGLAYDGRVQWLDLTDRSRPSDEPLVTDPERLRLAAGTAYVILRPTGDLADAFARWQGEVLDRLGGVRATVPAAHVTLKAFGSEGSPITPPDEERIAEVVAGWAAASPPIELRAVGLDVFEGDERVPIVRLAPVPVLADLWTRATAAGLPAGYSDPIGANAWIPHLSLAYPDEPDPARWAELVAWARGVDTGELACLAVEAELIVFDGGPQRRLGRFELGGS
jgi:CubicO group peptidase (beta-lactamase class C family)